MTRLPQPGADAGKWGDILNDYLMQSHKPNGMLKDNIITSDAISAEAIGEVQLKPEVQTKLLPAGGTINQYLRGDKTFQLLTKTSVGLPNVDNTADVDKPVSQSAQAALDTKVTLGGDITGTINAPVVSSAYRPATVLQANSSDKIISTFQPSHGFSIITVSGVQSADATDYIRGVQSLKITTNGSGSPATSQKSNISPLIDLTGKHIRVRLKVDKPSNISQLYIYFSSDNVTSNWISVKPSDYISVLKPNVWTTLTFSQGRNSQITGAPVISAINAVAVRVVDDASTPVAVNINEISYFDQPSAGVVTFTFDDNKATQYTAARPILDRYGYPATVYTIAGKVGTSGYMTLSQLTTLKENGWDISNHTFSHPYLTTLTDAQIDAEFYQSKQWFLQNGFTKGASDMALPHGDYNDDHVLPIARKYFRSVRTINNQVETYPAGDVFKLRTLYVTSSMTLATAKTAVDKAIAAKEWLILTFHNIETPVTAPESWTISDFDALVSYIASSGATVKTLADILNNSTVNTSGSASNIQLTGDLSGTPTLPTVVSTHLTTALPVSQGGTGLSTLTSGNVLVATSSSSIASSKLAPAGTIVGTSDAQTLSNKTLASPIISGTPPVSSASSGTAGQIVWGSDYLYVCVINGTWKRCALSTW